MDKIFKFELGDYVKDSLLGFEGFIEERVQCLNGCIQYRIQPKVGKDGKIPDACQLDEQNLELIKSAKKKTKVNRDQGPTRKMCSKYSK